MPSVEELLNQPIEEGYAFSTDDADAYCQVDELGRIITLNYKATVLGVEHDKAVERVFFACPRYVGDNVDLDLTRCTVYINYMNAGGEKDRYIVTDLNVAEDDETKVTFSWLLSRKVTAIRGDVHFIVCAVKTKTGGEIEQEWNTTIARANVLEGLEPDEYVLGSEDMDVVNQLLDMVAQEIDQKGQRVLESIPEDYTDLSEEVEDGRKANDLNFYASMGKHIRANAERIDGIKNILGNVSDLFEDKTPYMENGSINGAGELVDADIGSVRSIGGFQKYNGITYFKLKRYDTWARAYNMVEKKSNISTNITKQSGNFLFDSNLYSFGVAKDKDNEESDHLPIYTIYKDFCFWGPKLYNKNEEKKYLIKYDDVAVGANFYIDESSGELSTNTGRFYYILPVFVEVDKKYEIIFNNYMPESQYFGYSYLKVNKSDLTSYETISFRNSEVVELEEGYYYLFEFLSRPNNYSEIEADDISLYKFMYNDIYITIRPKIDQHIFLNYSNNEVGLIYPNATRLTTKYFSKEECSYVYVDVPEGLVHRANIRSLNEDYINQRFNTSGTMLPMLYPVYDYTIITLYKSDGSAFSYDDLSEDIKAQIKIKPIKTKNFGEVVIGNRLKSYGADIVCTGEDDQKILQAAFGSVLSIKIRLLGGVYHIKELYEDENSGEFYAIKTNELVPSNDIAYKTISLIGEYTSRVPDMNETIFKIDIDPNSIDDSRENSIFLVPRNVENQATNDLSNTIVNIKNISILSSLQNKPIINMDLTHAQASSLENIFIRADGYKNGVYEVLSSPNDKSIGIRVGYGSNNGFQNYAKHCMVYGLGKGYSINGEHFIFEDCLAHHCLVGFAFGDRLTRGNFEHPNIMLGCSIEACKRLMTLNRYGGSSESTENAAYTLICIGLSTESQWNIPDDEGGGTQETLPILEECKGICRGRIELDWGPKSPFEIDGSGKKIEWTVYHRSGIYKGIGNTVYE